MKLFVFAFTALLFAEAIFIVIAILECSLNPGSDCFMMLVPCRLYSGMLDLNWMLAFPHWIVNWLFVFFVIVVRSRKKRDLKINRIQLGIIIASAILNCYAVYIAQFCATPDTYSVDRLGWATRRLLSWFFPFF